MNDCRIAGIGDLTVYDTAHRIGIFRKKHPNKVYLHRGTKKGAENLLGKKINERALNKDGFKCFEELSCEEIEDMLCIYKDDFIDFSVKRKGKSKCVN